MPKFIGFTHDTCILGVKGTEMEEVKEVSHDDSEKKKADDLWSAFKADVAVPIKRFVNVVIFNALS